MKIPVYRYYAMDLAGKHVQGYIEASNEYEAFNMLREESLYPFDVKKTVLNPDLLVRNPIFKIPIRYIVIFCQQMHVVMKSGVPLLQALQSIYINTRHKRFKKILGEVYLDIQKGINLSKSFRKHEEKLPNMFVDVVHAGEVSGNLELSFKYMAEYYDREYILKKRLLNALIYPIFVLVLTIALVQFLVSYVAPQFMGMYAQNDETLPTVTRILLKTSKILGGGRFVLGLIGLSIVIVMVVRRGNLKIHALILRLPLIGSMAMKVITTRICIIMSMLLKSGIPIVDSLDMTHNVIGNREVRAELKDIEGKISEGEDILYAFSNSKISPPIFIQLLSAGVISGSLEEAFDGVAKFYEVEIEGEIDRFFVLMEPILILIVGAIVGFISYALVLPIYRLIDIL